MKNKNPVLLLHNGNSKVKKLIAHSLNLEVADCITCFNSLDEKIKFLKSNKNIVTDLTAADTLANTDLYELKKYCQTIKVISSYKDDLDNLEDVFTADRYTKDIWLQAIHQRLWATDTIIWSNYTSEIASINKENIIFSPGRVGTHVLKDITGISKHVHHCDNFINSDRFNQVLLSKTIFSVYRKNFIDYVSSMEIANYLGTVMLTTKDNYQQNLDIVKSADPFELSIVTANNHLDSVLNFVDLLLLFKVQFSKQIIFTNLEQLVGSGKIKNVIKNPYVANKIITNYDYAKESFVTTYQPIYDSAISQIIRHCGITML